MQRNRILTSVLLFPLVLSACSNKVSQPAANPQPEELAFQDIENQDIPSPILVTEKQPITLGDETEPFTTLPEDAEPTVGITPTGVVVPILGQRDEGWLVLSACQDTQFIKEIDPIGRAHVVLDPGHGGRESGAISENNLKESDLNLTVVQKTKDLLEAEGATVALTRTSDYSVTTATRGHIAKQIDPALFVSVHHNSGNPNYSSQPGTIVFTKTGSQDSTRFGGIFYQNLDKLLTETKTQENKKYEEYLAEKQDYEKKVEEYNTKVFERDTALYRNGQIDTPPTMATLEENTSTPAPIEQTTTTTIPPAQEQLLPVPEIPTPPEPFTTEAVPEFTWVGGANAGVRSWTRADNKDYLSILRNSGEVPAVLAEFLYMSNIHEAKLLEDDAFLDKQAEILATSIIEYFSTQNQGSGFVSDQFENQDIGGSGGKNQCEEPLLEEQ